MRVDALLYAVVSDWIVSYRVYDEWKNEEISPNDNRSAVQYSVGYHNRLSWCIAKD